MTRDRDADRTTDLGVIWFGNGVDLAHRMEALAVVFAQEVPAPWGDRVAERIREVLHSPRPLLPELGDPPTAVPPATPIDERLSALARYWDGYPDRQVCAGDLRAVLDGRYDPREEE